MRDNRLNRQPSGPGRSTKRTRTPAPTSPQPGEGASAPTPRRIPPLNRGAAALSRAASKLPGARLAFTRRAIVLFAVLAVLALSFASSLRVWMVQSQELAAAQAQIDQRTARVAELESELQRWNDPAYVKAQARNRLGWVMPGEVGYRVVDANGVVMSGTADIEGIGASQPNHLATRWWDRLATSLERTDAEPVATPDATPDPTEPDAEGADPTHPAPTSPDADAAASTSPAPVGP